MLRVKIQEKVLILVRFYVLDSLVPTEDYLVCIHWIGLTYLLVCLGDLEFIIYVYIVFIRLPVGYYW